MKVNTLAKLFKSQLISVLLIVYCIFQMTNIANGQNFETYKKEIKEWDKNRITRLKAEDGWLNLAGRFILHEGKNTFGSDKSNDLVFPEASFPKFAGYFEQSNDKVAMIAKMYSLNNTEFKIGGKSCKDTILFHKDSSNNPQVSYQNLRWNIIQRNDKLIVRLRNLNHPKLASFKGIERFPIDTNWRIKAKFQKNENPKQIAITNILGQSNLEESSGKLIFQINKQEFALDVLDEDGEFFVIFADETNGETTYPSGRFIMVKQPNADGYTTIDFNKAYNPPCAFTDFATCPLPPKQNILPISILAGEKSSGH